MKLFNRLDQRILPVFFATTPLSIMHDRSGTPALCVCIHSKDRDKKKKELSTMAPRVLHASLPS